MESRAGDEAQLIEKAMSRGLWVLETIVTAAPLLGLLGTITGMMQAFNLIGNNGLVDPTGVTGGVAQALIATALGLFIAVIALFAFNFFSRRQSQVLDEMERLGTRMVSCMPIPVPAAGSCSHPCGTGIAAIFIGPLLTVVVSSVALLLQALFLAHGGLSTLGANLASMGIAGAFAGYGIFILVRRLTGSWWIAAFLYINFAHIPEGGSWRPYDEECCNRPGFRMSLDREYHFSGCGGYLRRSLLRKAIAS